MTRQWCARRIAGTLLTILWLVAAAASIAGNIHVAATPGLAATPSIAENEIGVVIFVSEQDGHPEIYRVNTDGSNLRRLTYTEHGSINPRWSPDGEHIAFIAHDREPMPGEPEYADLYVMDADGSHQKRLTFSGEYHSIPQWWPDGQSISLFSRDTFQKINLDGSAPQSLFEVETGVSYNASSPAILSPNGRYIAVNCYVGVEYGCAKIVLLNSNRTPAEPFVMCSISRIAEGSWSPDSEHILCTNVQGKGVNLRMFNRDGSPLKFDKGPYWPNVPGGNEAFVWSPNGKYIVAACCAGLEPSGPELVITVVITRDLKSSAQASVELFSSITRLPDDPNKRHWFDPHVGVGGFSWAPDSQRLVFALASEHFELDIMKVDASERTPILVSAAPMYDPHWSPRS